MITYYTSFHLETAKKLNDNNRPAFGEVLLNLVKPLLRGEKLTKTCLQASQIDRS